MLRRLWGALYQTGLLKVHSAASLQAALRSERCATCPQFGPYLFLPTCRRCCGYCLYRIFSWRVIPTEEARDLFGLEQGHIQKLGVLKSNPKHYPNLPKLPRTPLQLVSVREAKELSILVHGPTGVRIKKEAGPETAIAAYIRSASLNTLDSDLLPLVRNEWLPEDRFFGTDIYPLPLSSDGGQRGGGPLVHGLPATPPNPSRASL